MAARAKSRRRSPSPAARVSHDYRGHGQGRRGVPPLLWLGLGLAVGLLVALVVFLSGPAGAPSAADAAARVAPAQDTRDVRKPLEKTPIPAPPRLMPAAPEPEPPPRFEFYRRLPQQGVDIPAEELRALQPESPSGPPTLQPDVTYVLQAGSFKTSQQAESLRARLTLLGFRVHVERADGGGEQWHRVRLGPFTDNDSLMDARERLTREGIASIALQVKE